MIFILVSTIFFFEIWHYSNITCNIVDEKTLKTKIWNKKKKKLKNGPKFPNSFLDMNAEFLCSATLDRSHVMLIDCYSIGYCRVVIFDSVKNLWHFISDLELDYNLYLYDCRASVAIDKSGKK